MASGRSIGRSASVRSLAAIREGTWAIRGLAPTNWKIEPATGRSQIWGLSSPPRMARWMRQSIGARTALVLVVESHYDEARPMRAGSPSQDTQGLTSCPL